jgi:hypothetical protein
VLLVYADVGVPVSGLLLLMSSLAELQLPTVEIVTVMHPDSLLLATSPSSWNPWLKLSALPMAVCTLMPLLVLPVGALGADARLPLAAALVADAPPCAVAVDAVS